MVGGELILCGDEEIALDAAFAGGPGILVIAGTGAIAIGRAGVGELFTVRADGGRCWAMRARATGLGWRRFGQRCGAQDRHWDWMACRLVCCGRSSGTGGWDRWVNWWRWATCGRAQTSPDFAELAPLVVGCAEDGDALAAGILERAGEELAELVALVYHKMAGGMPAAMRLRLAWGLREVCSRGLHGCGETMVARLAISVPGGRVGEVSGRSAGRGVLAGTALAEGINDPADFDLKYDF